MNAAIKKGGAVTELFGNKRGSSGAAQAAFSASKARYGEVLIADIKIKPQIRTSSFDGEDNTIAELAQSIRDVGIAQPILLRELKNGYELVAGERRIRAALVAGLTEIPAFIRVLSDDDAAKLQAAENLHRQNLVQLEMAQRVLKVAEELNDDRDAIAAHFSKSKGWVSKQLALTRLSGEAQALAADGVSSDPEVLVGVSNLEKVDKDAAAKVSGKLRESQGVAAPGKARETVKEATKEVKAKQGKPTERKKPKDKGSEGVVATAPGGVSKEPSVGETAFSGAKVAGIEQRLFGLIRDAKNKARSDTKTIVLEALETLAEDDTSMLRAAAQESFDQGREQSQTPAVWLRELVADVVPLEGNKRFVDWQTGGGVVMWLAYTLGATKRDTFELSELLGALR